MENGFWNAFIRPGLVLDIGYKGVEGSSPLFPEAIGIDIDTPGYDGRNLPFLDESVGTVHASHLLEHIADYGDFFRECFRVLTFEGTLIIFVPLMEGYEHRRTPPSSFNTDHKRFYTASRLLYEIETQLPREMYRMVHLKERIRPSNCLLPIGVHGYGPYEIECVIEKLWPDRIY